jgi:hypothetical protein
MTTTEEILKGFRFRLKNLKQMRKNMIKKDGHSLSMVVQDLDVRIDEVDSLYRWVREKARGV